MSDELEAFAGDDETGEGEAAATPAEQAPVADASEATGESTTAATPAAVDAEVGHVPIAALLDERAKRQDLERELDEYRTQTKEQTRPDASEDPEGALAFAEQKSTAQMGSLLINVSRMVAMGQHDDYLEKEAKFLEMSKSNPAVVEQMLASENPAKYAYDTAVKASELEAIQDVDSYKARLEAEIRAKIEAENAAGAAQTAAQAAAAGIPSLASMADAVSGHAAPTEKSLEEILGR